MGDLREEVAEKLRDQIGVDAPSLLEPEGRPPGTWITSGFVLIAQLENVGHEPEGDEGATVLVKLTARRQPGALTDGLLFQGLHAWDKDDD